LSARGINPDFESLRTALMNSYNSQTTNHVAVVVALTVGIFVLVSTKGFRELYYKHRTWFLFVLSLPFSLVEYFAERTLFWAWMSSMVLTVTQAQARSMHPTTIIYGIQTYLTNHIAPSVHTVSITLYQLDQKQFGTSFTLLYFLTFLLFYVIFGIYSVYCDTKSDKELSYDSKRDKWYESNRVKIQRFVNAVKDTVKRTFVQIGISVLIVAGLILLISFTMFLILTFLFIYVFFGFYLEYCDTKSDKELSYDSKRDKWYESNRVKIQRFVNAVKSAVKKRGMQIGISVLIVAGLILLILTIF
jgi:very-short-patch-repair endonuclease